MSRSTDSAEGEEFPDCAMMGNERNDSISDKILLVIGGFLMTE